MKPSLIHGVSIRARGTSAYGQRLCTSIFDPVQQSYPVEIYATMTAGVGSWIAFYDSYLFPGSFQWASTFVSTGGTTWQPLHDGTCELTLRGFAGYAPECFESLVEATLSMDEVSLAVDGEFPTPAKVSTWGRIKAWYR
ncbi:MAG: hypothetical protein ABI960_02595 [Candidatus Eisenbacteria bacterium]